MITQEQQKQGAELMKTLIEKAWESAEFKRKLIENPSKTIGDLLGKSLEEEIGGKEIIVVDQTDANKFYLNIPSITYSDLELTEEQLDIVSGGGPAYDAGYWVGTKIKEFYEWATS